MSGRLGLIAGGALIAAIAVLVLLGRGGEGATAQEPVRLGWEGTPRLIRVAELPRDRILTGRVRNASLRPVSLDVKRIVIVDDRGRTLKSSARMLQAFAHGLYSRADAVQAGGTFERTRLGEIATIKPGDTRPLTLSWRLPPGTPRAAEVRFGGGSLRLPD